MRKIEILDRDAQRLFDSPPHLTQSDQKNYFTLQDEVKEWSKTIATPTNLVGFILLWGYMRCIGRFFPKTVFAESDIQFICLLLNLDRATIDLSLYNQRTYRYHKQIVRKHLQIQPFDSIVI